MQSVVITPDALELAAREQQLAETREQRVSAAQSLILECYTRKVRVLRPYTTFEGDRRYFITYEDREIC